MEFNFNPQPKKRVDFKSVDARIRSLQQLIGLQLGKVPVDDPKHDKLMSDYNQLERLSKQAVSISVIRHPLDPIVNQIQTLEHELHTLAKALGVPLPKYAEPPASYNPFFGKLN